jgi:PAS domain S-box-containing protein
MRHGRLEPASLQRMLYETLDQSDDVVLVLEQDGDASELRIASANTAFCRVSGVSNDDLIGRTFRSLVTDDGSAKGWNAIVRAASSDGSCNSELLCNRLDGTTFWFGLHLMPVRGSDPQHFIILGRDITESRLAREQQAAVQGLLAKVFLCVKAPVAIVSDTGLIQMTNPALDELLGRAAANLVGTEAMDLVAPYARAVVVAARQRQTEDGHDFTLSTRMLHVDGGEIAVEITSIMVQRDDLRRFRIVTVLRQPKEPAGTVHVAGKIKLIGLEEVKEALGSRWNSVAARAMAGAEHVIQRHCGVRDTYSRTADGGFLICFGETTEEEASFRAASLAREIRSRLIGNGESEVAANVSAIAAAVDVPNVPGRTVDMLAATISERLNSRLAQIEERARDTLRQAIQTTRCRLEPVRNPRTRKVVASFARLPSDLENRVLAAYSALPMSERQDFDFDRLVLGIAVEQAITEIAKGGSLLVLVNVDFDVFLVRRRTERYVAACQALDLRLRERLILILSGMPKGFPKSRLLECVVRLRPFCHGVGFQSKDMEVPTMDFSSLGTAFVVLQDDAPTTSTDLAVLRKRIDALHAHRAHVLVRHLPSWEVAAPLAGLGVDLVTLAEDEHDAASA